MLNVQSGSEPFGLWGVTNGIRANLHYHRRVWARGADMGFIAHVGPAGCTAWHMCPGIGCMVVCAKRERS